MLFLERQREAVDDTGNDKGEMKCVRGWLVYLTMRTYMCLCVCMCAFACYEYVCLYAYAWTISAYICVPACVCLCMLRMYACR